MSTEELKCCPFCGGKADPQRFGNRDGGASYAVWCNSCHISTPWMHGDDGEQRAIATWNRRAPSSNSPEFDGIRSAAPAAGTEKDAEPIAWARKWHVDGEKPTKERNANGRMAWPQKFKLHAITPHKIFPDDVPLVAAKEPPCSS